MTNCQLYEILNPLEVSFQRYKSLFYLFDGLCKISLDFLTTIASGCEWILENSTLPNGVPLIRCHFYSTTIYSIIKLSFNTNTLCNKQYKKSVPHAGVLSVHRFLHCSTFCYRCRPIGLILETYQSNLPRCRIQNVWIPQMLPKYSCILKLLPVSIRYKFLQLSDRFLGLEIINTGNPINANVYIHLIRINVVWTEHAWIRWQDEWA